MNVAYFLVSILQHMLTAFKIKVFQKRFRTIKLFGIHPEVLKKKRVLFVITHIVPDPELLEATILQEKVTRLQATIDGILDSFAGYSTHIVLNTSENMHVVSHLPDEYKEILELRFSTFEDPMYAGFRTFDILKDKKEEAEYFFFVEDDILIQDATFLDKIESFNAHASDTRWLLFPHRYEMIGGKKFYLDQEVFYGEKIEVFAVNKVGQFSIGDYSFAEFENSHSGIFVLSKQQLEIWIDSGYQWRNKSVAFGPLESAATFLLYECFKIFKPNASNMHFLEVKHWGTKYSSRFYKK